MAAYPPGAGFALDSLLRTHQAGEPGLRYAAEAGLRYVTPVGPLAFDVGVNLDRDPAVNEPAAQPHFSIGLF